METQRRESVPLDVEALFRAYGDGMFRLALRLCGNSDDAQDLVAETLAQAVNAKSQYRGDGVPKAWLFRILVNQWRMHCRKRRREESIGDADRAVETMALTLVSERLDLARAMRKLSPEKREAFLLVKGEGFTFAEAAEILGKPQGTVAWQVQSALVELRHALSPEPEPIEKQSWVEVHEMS
ncbi:MAG: RNA polymerase sigma factor [Fimbriimonadaceae bacterium]|nr:RNA polymerase sigma factor [Fimbriimonadaceae bacterium]